MAENEKSSGLGEILKEGSKEGLKRAVATIVHYKIIGLVAIGAVAGFFYFNVPGMIGNYLWDKTAGAAADAASETVADAKEAVGNAKDATLEGARNAWDKVAGAAAGFRDEWYQPEVYILEMDALTPPIIEDSLPSYVMLNAPDVMPQHRTTQPLFEVAAAPNLVIGEDLEIGAEPAPGRFSRAWGALKNKF
jgi:hypothetical protein